MTTTGRQQRHEDNRKLLNAGFAKDQREADALRKKLNAEGRSIDDFVANGQQLSTPEPPAYDAAGYNPAAAGANPGDIHVHVVLRPNGSDKVNDDLAQSWLQAQSSV